MLIAAMAMLITPLGVRAQPDRGDLLSSIPVSGTLSDGGTFEGTATITELAYQGGNLVVSGVLNGTATPDGGPPTAITDQAFETTATLTQDGGNGQCQILFLDIGPIFLDLLGLQVDLSEITLDITAVSGPGNLLGNLLCGVAHLLDKGGPTSGLNNLLNRITNLLG